ncbi:glycosyltransferase family 4 protein [Bythopirellula polymerisocia]|uniref:D-inositol-3-phosphate glycosyltransferase n=1 Tax=Bythopirellula polymerisocia TaxID=2528003 RepID=A0A5C6CTZ2_9BACT|nr:glycosyltransferase family 4 protein [Bythopirellula polymerisocia]TWU28090.1 D-inositol-3-phosphate glycosyltransferase [Bythopirellula polymerisocia]
MGETTTEPSSCHTITFVGPLPPPVTGMTAMSEVIVQALAEQGPLKCFNWSREKSLKGFRWKLARLWGAFCSFWGLLQRGRQPKQLLYYPVNSSWGMLYDFALLGLGKLLGYRIVLHHHVYSYLNEFDWRMGLINKLVGSNGAHVVHCQKMENDFRAHYETTARFLFIPPTIVSPEITFIPRKLELTSDKKPFVLGFLSNLTLAKGLHLVIKTFEAAIAKGLDVRLILAGPCMQREAEKLIQDSLARWPRQVEYRGPLYGEAKVEFYRELDTFLFPTQYKNESWGIVLTEALTAGCPVIAYDRGCISYIIQDGCGKVVPQNCEFAAESVQLIGQWISAPESFRQARQHAVERNQTLQHEAAAQLPLFVNQMWTMK